MINDKLVRLNWMKVEEKEMRRAFGEAVYELAKDDKNIICLTADLGKSLRLDKFSREFPSRYFNVGVAEQNMVGVASGMASEGKTVFATSFAVFSPGRSWDQVRISVASMNSNVKIIGSHGGLSVGKNGFSHQALEDIAIMRVLANMVVISPSDYTQTKHAVKAISRHKGPVYMRFPRMASPDFSRDIEFEIGKAYKYRDGKDVSIFCTGQFVYDALLVAQEQADYGIECEVVNVSTIKPIDEDAIRESVGKTGKVITWEDHQKIGGLGSAVAEVLSESGISHKLVRVGVEDKFGESGEPRELFDKYGIGKQNVKEVIKDLLR